MKLQTILYSKKRCFTIKCRFLNLISFAGFCSSLIFIYFIFRVVPTSPDNRGSTVCHFSKTTLSQLHACSITVYKNTVINIIIIFACGINFRAPGKKIPCLFWNKIIIYCS